jgi:hypothetical protein
MSRSFEPGESRKDEVTDAAASKRVPATAKVNRSANALPLCAFVNVSPKKALKPPAASGA